jgi:hypothetical protein
VDRLLDAYRLDKTVVTVSSLADDCDERAFWHAQTPEARLQALEFMRRVMYGDAATARLQRVLAVDQLEPG